MATLPQPPAPVRPPSDYTAPTPTGAVVTTYAELAAEMALAGPRVVVVADGDYVGPALTTNQGHRIWAQRQGAVTFRFGIGFRGNAGLPGGEVHGVVFDVDSAANVDTTAIANEAIINTWDAVAPIDIGSDLLIEDCAFYGNGAIGSGIQAVSPGGLIVRRCVFRGFLDAGVFAFRNGSAPDAFEVIVLEDIDIADVSRVVPGSSNGLNAEVGINVGHTCIIRRVRVRDCAWAGIALVNDVSDWVIEDFDIDRCGWGYFAPGGVGIYCEHCRDGVIRRGNLGPELKIGVNVEWNSSSTNPYENSLVPRNSGIEISEVLVRAYKIGFHFDLSAASCSVSRCRIERAWFAAVLDNNSFPNDAGDWPPPSGEDPIVSTNTIDEESCSFLLHASVPLVRHAHHGTAALLPTIPGWPLSPLAVDVATLTLTAFGAMARLSSLLLQRMPTMLRSAPQARALTQWLAVQLSEAQEAIESAHAPLAYAQGRQLDRHGAGLLRPRVGLPDGEYRTELWVKFAALFRARSPALAVDLLRRLTEGTAASGRYHEWLPAAYEYVLEDVAADVAARWEALLRTAKPEGVRMQTRVVEDAAIAFRFDSGPGYDEGHYAYTLES